MMMIKGSMKSMDNTSIPAADMRWTLADLLSSYRFWALYLATLFATIGVQILNLSLPLISSSLGATYQEIGIFSLGSNVGLILGAFTAFSVAGRRPRASLMIPLIVAAAVALAFLQVPGLWTSPLLLFAMGATIGTVHTLFPLATATFLVGARPSKIDFGCALALLSMTSLSTTAASFMPVYQNDRSGETVIFALLACLVLAAIVLAPVRDLDFSKAPRPRHKAFAPRRRSPLLIAIIYILPIIALLRLLFVAASGQGESLESPSYGPFGSVASLAIFLVAIVMLIYLAYWVYRIHGELAGVAASQRLLTPFSAMCIAILIPLGLPVILMTLADLINDRARENGTKPLISIAVVVILSLVFPPLAIALVQYGANKSYGIKIIEPSQISGQAT